MLDEAVLYLGAVADEYIEQRTKPLVDRYTVMLHIRWRAGPPGEGPPEPADVLVARLAAGVLNRAKSLTERLAAARAKNPGEAIALQGELSRFRLNLTDAPVPVPGGTPDTEARSVLIAVDQELRKEVVTDPIERYVFGGRPGPELPGPRPPRPEPARTPTPRPRGR